MQSAVFVGLCIMVVLVITVRGARDDMINSAVARIDSNGDGNITKDELHSQLISVFDQDGDNQASLSEFLDQNTGWPYVSGDTVANAQTFFENLDKLCTGSNLGLNNCGFIGSADIAIEAVKMDNDPQDATISISELTAWFNKVYP